MKGWARWALSIVALLVLASYVMGSVDYWRIQEHNVPCFTVTWGGFLDGGSMVGLGFGYYVVENDGVKYSLEHPSPDQKKYRTEGPELKFWFFPFLNISELKFTPYDFPR